MQRLAHFLAKHDTLRGNPALDEDIKVAEEKLNVKFHGDYKAFIKRFGGAYAGMPIHAFSNGSSIGKETVVELTLDSRASYAGDERAVELNSSYVISSSLSQVPEIRSSSTLLAKSLSSTMTATSLKSWLLLLRSCFKGVL